MPLDEPSWWYGAQPSRYAQLLKPLSRVYAFAAARRIERQPRYRSKLPVLCIGNFTAGGSGKTPLALAVAKLLITRGVKPAFLTRGYGGCVRGPLVVDSQRHGAREVGDEPLLLARLATTVVARDRADGARAIEDLSPRPAAIVMDDGLHNPGLAKDFVLVAVDGGRGLGNGEVIPAGPLRAPLELQLKLADAIVVVQSPAPSANVHAWRNELRERFAGPVLNAQVRPAGNTGWLRDARIMAFAGIANPNRFFAMLASLGAEVIEAVPFADHHVFKADEAARLLDMASSRGAVLVTTEKDWVRLLAIGGLAAVLRARSRPVAMELAFDDRELARLEALILPLLAAPRR